ncbi:rod shape-determining protein [Streptomyces sp. NPDC002851]
MRSRVHKHSTGQGFAIDLGSATMRIRTRGAEQVLRSPTIAAIGPDGRIQARGARALSLQGLRTENLRLVRPVHHRTVADPALASHLLQWALTDAQGGGTTGRRTARRTPRRLPGATVCVPDDAGEVQLQALLDVCDLAGLRHVRMVPKSVASAAGSGIPQDLPAGALVVDVGAERTSASLLCFGGLVATRTAAVGGADIDAALIRLLKREHGLIICTAEAERAKLRMGPAAAASATICLRGQDMQHGLPADREVPATDLVEVPGRVYASISSLILGLLSDSPPKLLDDVYDRGLVLCGEGAQLHGLADHVRDRVEIAVHVPPEPGDVGVVGAWAVSQD